MFDFRTLREKRRVLRANRPAGGRGTTRNRRWAIPTAASWIPLRWPSAWIDPALLGLLEGTPFNCLAMEWNDALSPVAARARAAGFSLVAIGNEAARAAAAGAGMGPPAEGLPTLAGSGWPGVGGSGGG